MTTFRISHLEVTSATIQADSISEAIKEANKRFRSFQYVKTERVEIEEVKQ